MGVLGAAGSGPTNWKLFWLEKAGSETGSPLKVVVPLKLGLRSRFQGPAPLGGSLILGLVIGTRRLRRNIMPKNSEPAAPTTIRRPIRRRGRNKELLLCGPVMGCCGGGVLRPPPLEIGVAVAGMAVGV